MNAKPSAKEFTWGRVEAVHEIGPYRIFEYLSKHSKFEERLFHCFVDGKDIHESAPSLDHAILVCMASKHCGLNSRAAQFAAKILDLK